MSQLSMFTKPSYRKRLGITCFYCFLGQSTAILVRISMVQCAYFAPFHYTTWVVFKIWPPILISLALLWKDYTDFVLLAYR